MVPQSGIEFTITESIRAIEENIPGIFVECGVWKGGCGVAMLLAQQEAFGEVRRPVYLLDSFMGLPQVEKRDGPALAQWQASGSLENCLIEREVVQESLDRFGFKEGEYFIIEGWFEDTLHRLNDMAIAFLRIDCDLYASVKPCLDFLVPNVSVGGTVIIDDYYAWDGCVRAVHDHFSKNDFPFRIKSMPDFSSAYFTKTEKDISHDYDKKFFEMHEQWKDEYELVALSILENLEFETVVDLGCGNGFILSYLEQNGKDVDGIDGSANATFPGVEVIDISKPICIGKYDLVICSEVAEHIEEKYADTLIDNICNASNGLIFFSAATPGHGGHLHINEQEHEYWINKFQKRGFIPDEEITIKMRVDLSIISIWWFPANLIMFRR